MEGLKLIPYMYYDGVPTFTDSQLEVLYNKLVDQSLIMKVFIDGTVNSFNQFLNFIKNSKTISFVPEYNGIPIGMIWANQFETTTAQGHFVFFKEVWGTGYPQMAAKMFCRLLTKHVSTLIGVVPNKNKLAIKFCATIGMHFVGVVPHMIWGELDKKPLDASIFYITKDDFKDENLDKSSY